MKGYPSLFILLYPSVFIYFIVFFQGTLISSLNEMVLAGKLSKLNFSEVIKQDPGDDIIFCPTPK